MMKLHLSNFLSFIYTYIYEVMRFILKQKVPSLVYTKMSYADLDFTTSKDLKITPTNKHLDEKLSYYDYFWLTPLLNELFVALNPSLSVLFNTEV